MKPKGENDGRRILEIDIEIIVICWSGTEINGINVKGPSPPPPPKKVERKL